MNLQTRVGLKNLIKMKYILAFVSILLGSIAQYLLKKGITDVTRVSHGYIQLLKNSISNISLIIGLSFYALSMVFWLYVLSKMQLSKAYPMVSLGYVFTLFLGYFLLNESLSAFKLIGIMLVICGVIFISRG